MDDPLDIAIAADSEAIEAALEARRDEICGGLKVALAAAAWAPLRLRLARALLREIGDNWLGWLLEGWGKAREIGKYGKADVVASGATASVKIGRHSPSVTVPIEVTVTCAGAGFPPIPFEATLAAELDAVVLWIRGGYVFALEGGACETSLELRLDGHALCDPLKLKTLKLPGRKDFAPPGIAIPGREAPLIATPVAEL